jgi:hypothetical protein
VIKSSTSNERRLQALGTALGLLWEVAIDQEDPIQSAAYYGHADQLLAVVLATPAHGLAGLRVKAEFVAWCCASRTDFALGQTSSERVIHSLLIDLLPN